VWGLRTCLVLCCLANASACGSGECGEGTVRHQDTCLTFDPFDTTPPTITVDPPVRTRRVGNVRLTSNEPAEIFVTTDDSTPTLDSTHEPDQLVIANDRNDLIVRFFAVDLAGNQSAEQTVLWNIDDQGPSPAVDFRLVVSGDTRTATWSPPQSETRLGGVVVARIDGRLNAQPTNGTTYAVGDVIAPGITVVDVRDNDPAPATFSESLATPPGMVRYVAWSFDDLLNYGPPAGDFVVVPLPPQRAKLLLDQGDGSLSTVNKPTNITFSGNVTFATGTLTAKLSMRNDSTRVLFAPKVFMTNTLPDGVVFESADGDADIGAGDVPFRAYGSALPPGAVVTLNWVFTGVAANTPLTIDLDVRDGPILLASSQSSSLAGSVVDLSVSRETDTLALGPGGTRGTFFSAGGGITPDGLVIMGSHSSGTITSWDLTTGNRVQVSELRPQKAHVAFALLDRSGSHGYALMGGGHAHEVYRNGTADTDLIRFDTATLAQTGSLAIGPSRNRDIRMSSDGRFLVVPTGVALTGAIVVDLDAFRVARNLTTGEKIEDVAFSPDNTTVALASHAAIVLVDVRDGTVLETLPMPSGPINRMLKVTFNGTSELWVGRRQEVIKFSLDAEPPVAPLQLPFQGRLLESIDGKVVAGNSSIDQLESDGTASSSFCCFQSQRGHWLGRSPF
jgi:hypothetical protein